MIKPSSLQATAFLVLAVTNPSCGPATSRKSLTVEELVSRIDELNGQTVRVAGYLQECRGYECNLYPTKGDADVWERFYAALDSNKPATMPDRPVLGIGGGTSDDFDKEAACFTNGYVVITGIVTNECRFEGKRACTDRSPDLEPTAIRAGSPPQR